MRKSQFSKIKFHITISILGLTLKGKLYLGCLLHTIIDMSHFPLIQATQTLASYFSI